MKISHASPLPLSRALAIARQRGILPTHWTTAELRTIEAAIRRNSVFAARVTNAEFVEEIRRVVERMLDPARALDPASARKLLLDALDHLGYDATSGGFPGEQVEPAETDSLRDVASRRRLDLILRTQTGMMHGWAKRERGLDAARIEQFPAWELKRLFPRAVPRGLARRKSGIVQVPGDSWPERWQKAGGGFVGGGRMVAHKLDAIWETIGDSSLFDDGLDNPYPPFAFNSGYWVDEIDREEASRLGIEPVATAQPPPSATMPSPRASAAGFAAGTLDALKSRLRADIVDGELRTIERNRRDDAAYDERAAARRRAA